MMTEVKKAKRESPPAFLATMFQPAWMRPAMMIRAKACSDMGRSGESGARAWRGKEKRPRTAQPGVLSEASGDATPGSYLRLDTSERNSRRSSGLVRKAPRMRSEEHTSELQSP